MADYELFLAIYPGRGCDQALQQLRQREKAGELRLYNVAVATKDDHGITTLHEDQDLDAGQGSVFGAIVGGLIGLLGGPAGVVVGAAVGAATGGLVAGKIDLGFEDPFLKAIQANLKPGTSALLVMAEVSYADNIAQTLSGFVGNLHRHVIRADVINELRKTLDD